MISSKRQLTKAIGILVVFFPLLAFGQIGKTRAWTDSSGNEFVAKLVRINEDSVLLDVRGQTFTIELEKLSKVDQTFIKGLTKPAAGAISDFEVHTDEKLTAWIKENHMRSLQWKGKPDEWSDEMNLNFQLHVPPKEKRKFGEKYPLLVHLHGTGGIGENNLQQFGDGGEVAKKFMSKEFQEKQACYIMLPQTPRMSGWYALAYTDPSQELEAIVHAIKLMAQSPDYDVDLSRIYVTGLSMGGAGAFQAMAKFPGFFAAAAPTSYVDIPRLFNRNNCGPMWVAVNAGDYRYEEDLKEFTEHYISVGGTIKTSVFNNKGHDAWTQLYTDESFRDWLFQQKIE